MKIEQWEIDKPIPYDRNPRIISAEAVDQVANSLSEAGWQQPIVVNKDGIIIVGHTRLQAAKKLGMKEVPVLVADLTKEQEDRYRLRDNKSGEFSMWDFDMLKMDWEVNDLEEIGFDIGGFGIDDAIDSAEEGEEIEVAQSLQIDPPKEYIIIMADPNSVEWENLKEMLQLKMVRRGGYKKGSDFDALGLERVLQWEDFKDRYAISSS